MTAGGAYHAILLTHPHYDHFADVLPLLLDDPALKIVTQFDVGEWLKTRKIPAEQIIGMNTGGTLPFQNARITMVPAVHTSSVAEDGAPRALGFPIGYVIRFSNGFTIYNTGDTAATMDMQIVHDLYKPNLVILPIGDFLHHGRGTGSLRAEPAEAAVRHRCPLGHLERHAPGPARRPRKRTGEIRSQDPPYQTATRRIAYLASLLS